MAKSPKEFEKELRELLEELRPYALVSYHPLVNGEIETQEELGEWARNFYVRDVAAMLAGIYAKCPHLDARRFIAENLYEEEGEFKPGRAHTELSRRPGKHFGLTDDEVEARYWERKNRPKSVTRREARPKEDWLEEFAGFGLGAEYFVPPLFRKVIPRLREKFGLPEDVLEFFKVHLEEDANHSNRTMEIILQYARTDEEQQKVKEAIKRWVFHISGKEKRLPDEILQSLDTGYPAAVGG